MPKRNISLSIDAEPLDRAEHLGREGENRSALVERLLREAVRIVEEAEIDAQYDRALAAHPLSEPEQAALRSRATAAYRSLHGPRG